MCSYDVGGGKILFVCSTQDATCDEFLPEAFGSVPEGPRTYRYVGDGESGNPPRHAELKSSLTASHGDALSKRQRQALERLQQGPAPQKAEERDSGQDVVLESGQIHVGEVFEVFGRAEASERVLTEFIVGCLCRPLEALYVGRIQHELNTNFMSVVRHAERILLRRSSTTQRDPAPPEWSHFAADKGIIAANVQPTLYDALTYDVDACHVRFDFSGVPAECRLYAACRLFRPIVHTIRLMKRALAGRMVTDVVIGAQDGEGMASVDAERGVARLNIIRAMWTKPRQDDAICDRFLRQYIYYDYLLVTGELENTYVQVDIYDPAIVAE